MRNTRRRQGYEKNGSVTNNAQTQLEPHYLSNDNEGNIFDFLKHTFDFLERTFDVFERTFDLFELTFDLFERTFDFEEHTFEFHITHLI